MRCFNHPDREAVGICKGCSKGLCTDCVVDLGHGIACKGVHEELVETYNTIVTKNARLHAAAQRNTLVAPLFYAFMGFLLLGYSLFNGDGFTSFLSLMGLGFLIFAAFVYRANRKVYAKDRNVA